MGNLPYHISSQLIFQYLPQRARWRQMTIMLQKELAEQRAAAPEPGAPGWSSFSAQIARVPVRSRGCSMCSPAPLHRRQRCAQR